jgi:hypothetical protein
MNRSDIMTRIRRFAIASFAALTVTAGSIGAVPTASALPLACDEMQILINAYWAKGWFYYSLGNYAWAYYWWGKAEGLATAGCVG